MSTQEILKCIADPTRRKILDNLKKGRKCASDIADDLTVTNATVSHHLKILKDVGLVIAVKEKNFIYYELSTTVFDEILIWIKDLKGE